MSTNKLQQASAVTVPLDAYALNLVHEFKVLYQQYQACPDAEESLAMGKQVDTLALRLAFYLESVVEKAEVSPLV